MSIVLQDETDDQLIRRYAQGRDERAFAVLVHRHGRLVAGVCARMLRNRADSDDAFQAVFMVLAQRAGSLTRPASLAGWLYSVAVRVCLNECRSRHRRRRVETEMNDIPHPSSPTTSWDSGELKGMIDEELNRLPAHMRDVLVLCDLEGRSRAEVGRLLSLPTATVTSRLKSGRQQIRRRLLSRGVTLSAAGWTTLLVCEAQAAPPITTELVLRTVRNAGDFLASTETRSDQLSKSAVALAEDTLHQLLMNRWKLYASVLVLAVTTIVGGAFASSRIVRRSDAPSTVTVVLDDFSDGSADDASPGMWHANAVEIMSVVGGDLVVRHRNAENSIALAKLRGTYGTSITLTDTSVRTQCRLNTNGWVGIVVRLNDSDWEHTNGYYAVIGDDMKAEIGLSGGGSLAKQVAQTDLNPRREDVVMQLEAIGDRISLRVWRPGDPMPAEPLLSFRDSAVAAGNPAVFGMNRQYPHRGDIETVFRYVQVWTSSTQQ